MGRSLQAVGLVVVVSVVASVAHGDPVSAPNPSAEKLFRDGRRLLKDGQIAAACDAFQASSKFESSVGIYLNLGDCRATLHQTASAWAAFVEAGRLAGQRGDPRKAEADRRASELEPKLSYLIIEVADRIDGLVITSDGASIDAAVWSQPVAIDPGRHVIAAKATGFDAWSTTIEIGDDASRARVEVPALHARLVPVSTATRPSTFTPTRDVALATAGVGVVAAGIAIGLLLDARQLDDQARARCPIDQPCHDLVASQTSERAVSRGTAAQIVGGIGAAAIVASVTLWFLGRPRGEAPRVVAAVAPGSMSFGVVGGF